MSDFFDLDIADEASPIVSKDIEFYKGVKNKTERLAIIYKRVPLVGEPDAKLKEQIEAGDREIIERDGKKFVISPWFIGGLTHFDAKVGNMLCLSQRDKKGDVTKKELCCTKFGEPRPYFICPVVIYSHVDKVGQPKKPFIWNIEVKVWKISEEKFKTLRRKNQADRKLLKGDVIAACSDDQFQKMDLDISSQAIWRLKPEWEDEVYDQALALEKSMKKALGRELSLDQLKEKLGLIDGTDFTNNSADADDISDLIE